MPQTKTEKMASVNSVKQSKDSGVGCSKSHDDEVANVHRTSEERTFQLFGNAINEVEDPSKCQSRDDGVVSPSDEIEQSDGKGGLIVDCCENSFEIDEDEVSLELVSMNVLNSSHNVQYTQSSVVSQPVSQEEGEDMCIDRVPIPSDEPDSACDLSEADTIYYHEQDAALPVSSTTTTNNNNNIIIIPSANEQQHRIEPIMTNRSCDSINVEKHFSHEGAQDPSRRCNFTSFFKGIGKHMNDPMSSNLAAIDQGGFATEEPTNSSHLTTHKSYDQYLNPNEATESCHGRESSSPSCEIIFDKSQEESLDLNGPLDPERQGILDDSFSRLQNYNNDSILSERLRDEHHNNLEDSPCGGRMIPGPKTPPSPSEIRRIIPGPKTPPSPSEIRRNVPGPKTPPSPGEVRQIIPGPRTPPCDLPPASRAVVGSSEKLGRPLRTPIVPDPETHCYKINNLTIIDADRGAPPKIPAEDAPLMPGITDDSCCEYLSYSLNIDAYTFSIF